MLLRTRKAAEREFLKILGPNDSDSAAPRVDSFNGVHQQFGQRSGLGRKRGDEVSNGKIDDFP